MKHKILIVDDEENILLVVKEAFVGKYEVLTANAGPAALEIIKREKPAFIFLDIKMPGMSGLEVLDQVKYTGVDTIVWMLTGEEDLEVAASTLESGAHFQVLFAGHQAFRHRGHPQRGPHRSAGP